MFFNIVLDIYPVHMEQNYLDHDLDCDLDRKNLVPCKHSILVAI